ncbi:fumarate reductase iron-sulfur subunit [Halodesulfovibrio sp.]|uniref:fumarate reductase iron-sulfur subunit n=1 Tax=Halodesulfovibrio sp. TaxID=1912772 RepID=UPI0025BCBC90|nr:fumarate reductase iron-sulfur subunit [Halodesulfovibrio sp.]
MSRRLHIEVFRYNPLDPNSEPHMESFHIDEYDSMTLFIALNIIRDQHDATLQFDFCCRAGICGSCGMVINGRPGLACHTQTKDLPDHIVLHPLPVFKLIGDLSVDTGVWFRDAGKRIEAWVHNDHDEFDPMQEEARMENSLANEIFELDRCVECGCCISACGTARMRPDFLGAAAIARVARFYLDPRDERNEENYYEVIGNDQGVFGCMGLLGCEDVCPKHIPLQDQLGIMRRMLALHSVKGILPKALINKLSHKGCCHENHKG